jgi:hypothetical protein
LKEEEDRRTGEDGNTDRYTVVTGTERRGERKRTGQDKTTQEFSIDMNWKRKMTGKGQARMRTETKTDIS